MNDPANQSSPKQLLSDDVKEDDIDLPLGEDLDEPIEESNEPVRDVAALISAIEWDSTIVSDGTSGADVIAALVKRLPNKPGVYRMFNEAGDVLYVGKAHSLKKRVSNYARGQGHTNRIGRMVRETTKMEFVVTRTETEALLLEANLIKRLRPRFNVLMRDDKSFPYILLTAQATDRRLAPAFSSIAARARAKAIISDPSHRQGRSGARSMRCSVHSCCAPARIRSIENRTRPCLLYQIKRCSGPCTGEISEADYDELVSEAKEFLSGRSQAVKTHLSDAMREASADLDFERAAVYRDRLAALSHVQSTSGINPQSVEEADVFAIHQEGGRDVHPGVFLPNRPELGQPRLLSQGRSGAIRRRSARLVPVAVL